MAATEGIEPARPTNTTERVATAEAVPALATPDVFPFPYPKPYDIQLDLMRTVFAAIEQRKIAIVESPTGTGKSLTLLTSTLTWLAENKNRLAKATEDNLRAQLAAEDPDDPPWVVEHALRARLTELRAAEEARLERLEGARAKEKQRRRAQTFKAGSLAGRGHGVGSHGAKRHKAGEETVGGDRGEGDAQFLPDDAAMGVAEGEGEEDGPRLSKEVQELMARYEAAKPKTHTAEEEEEDIPKIYYTSRTHTQLRQLTSELLKTSFPAQIEQDAPPVPSDATAIPEAAREGISLVPLGSRKQLCINDRVRSLAASGGGDERMNEACLDMQKSGGKRCEFLPREDDGRMNDARDVILASVRDIEDIVTLGKQSCVCPYYATRKAVKQAHLVTLPYNLLLQKNAREALGIDLKDQVIVIDEAHNLIDTLLSIYSCNINLHSLTQAVSQLSQYLARFKSRLKPIHALWINQTLSVLQGLVKVSNDFATGAGASQGTGLKSRMVDTTQLMASMAGANDQVNLMEMVKYLRESKLARKVSGFVEMTEEEVARKVSNGERKSASTSTRHASIAAFHQVESFLLALTDARDDGRIVFSLEMTSSGRQAVVLKYILLNPAERFKEVVESSRSVILAGGTMEPISDFLIQLFPSVPRSRFSTLSCSHVIPKNNLLTQVVSMGPKRMEFEFKFANRGDDTLLAELGAVITSIIGLVPDGVVVFLPSYAFLERVKTVWKASGLLDRLSNKKQLFYEPQTSSDVETILRDYSLAISSRTASAPTSADTAQGSAAKSRLTGALLFAVVGGKLSEGINFSDALGRCVIMVGLPFANVGSVELKERMKYVEGLEGAGKDAARELYENLCMRAVNQSIGRAIRHANDYATILLVDKRYATKRIRSKLPKWIGDDVQTPADFAGVAKGIAGFFREKRERTA